MRRPMVSERVTGSRPFGNRIMWAEIRLEPIGSEMPAKKATSRIQATMPKRERDKNPIDSVHSEMLPMSNRQWKQAAQRRKKRTNPSEIFSGSFQKRRIRLFNGNTFLHGYWSWIIQMLKNIKDTTHWQDKIFTLVIEKSMKIQPIVSGFLFENLFQSLYPFFDLRDLLHNKYELTFFS